MMTYPNARDCEHGQLRRSCNICEYERDIAERDQRIASLEAQLAEARRDQWRPIETAPSGKAVLIHYKNPLGDSRVIKARHIQRFTEESNGDADEGVDEHDEANDRYTYVEGWWEMLDNWDEYGFVKVYDGEPTCWHPLPDPPVST